jgi:RNA polymerase primary sigma factor
MSQQLIIINIVDATNKFYQINHRQPSSEEISEMIDVPREQIDYLSQFFNNSVSVDDFIGGDEENSQMCDIIPDGEPSLDELVNKQYIGAELDKILSTLSVREHDLICMLFGIGMPVVNAKVVAEMYGVCGERIRQMKEGALKKLRKKYGNKLKELI